MKKKIIFLHLTGGPLIREGKIVFTEGGLVHLLSASVHLAQDYQVEILCPNPPTEKAKKEIDYRGVKIIVLAGSQWLKLAQYGNLSFFREAFEYIKKSRPDFIFGNNLFASFLISFLSRERKRIGIIHHLYLTLPPQNSITIWLIKIFEKLALPFLRKLDGLAVINPLVKEILVKKGFPAEKIGVVGNGIDPSFYQFSEKKEENTLIFIGRLAPLKGVEDLIEVIGELKKENPKILLHIVGSGPSYHKIKRKVSHFGLKENILLHGYLADEEKREWLRKSQFYLSLSQLEGFGIPLIEAMAMGCIPVVSDIYAHRYIFQGKRVGYLVRGKKEMKEKIIELLKNEEERKALAQEGRRLVEEKWTWERVGQRYKELIENL